MRRWWSGLLSIFGDFNVEVLELRGTDTATVSKIRISGHGSGSDVGITETVWHAAGWRDGKCVWWRTCTTEAEALEVAGLSE